MKERREAVEGGATPAPAQRRIIGNLDFELELARAAGSSRRPVLPPAVLASISAMATLLRVFAGEEDRLWTPAPVEASRLPAVPGLPLPRLESGPQEKLPLCEQLLVWGEAPSLQPFRRAPATPEVPEERDNTGSDLQTPMYALPWTLPRSLPENAARVNHRAFCLGIAEKLGVALPGACIIQSIHELETHLRHGGAGGAREERWVVKAPLAAAGRSRLRQQGSRLEENARRRVEALLDAHGELLFEPWMERTADFGCTGLLGSRTLTLLPPHAGLLTPGGDFRGITVSPRSDSSRREDRSEWTPQERESLLETMRAVASHLRLAGYTGPFTVDSWRYRDVRGASRFHPLGEINARMSFGLVAAALAERLVDADVLSETSKITLRLATTERETRATEDGAGRLPLLLPTITEPTTAWVESS